MSIPYGTAWDNTIAVALPYGARTMQGAAAGSIGVCIPFVIFMCVMFQFMYAEHFVKQVSYSFPKRPPPSTARVFVNIMLPFQGSARCRQRPVFNTRRSNGDWAAQYWHHPPSRPHRSAQVPEATQRVFP